MDGDTSFLQNFAQAYQPTSLADQMSQGSQIGSTLTAPVSGMVSSFYQQKLKNILANPPTTDSGETDYDKLSRLLMPYDPELARQYAQMNETASTRRAQMAQTAAYREATLSNQQQRLQMKQDALKNQMNLQTPDGIKQWAKTYDQAKYHLALLPIGSPERDDDTSTLAALVQNAVDAASQSTDPQAKQGIIDALNMEGQALDAIRAKNAKSLDQNTATPSTCANKNTTGPSSSVLTPVQQSLLDNLNANQANLSAMPANTPMNNIAAGLNPNLLASNNPTAFTPLTPNNLFTNAAPDSVFHTNLGTSNQNVNSPLGNISEKTELAPANISTPMMSVNNAADLQAAFNAIKSGAITDISQLNIGSNVNPTTLQIALQNKLGANEQLKLRVPDINEAKSLGIVNADGTLITMNDLQNLIANLPLKNGAYDTGKAQLIRDAWLGLSQNNNPSFAATQAQKSIDNYIASAKESNSDSLSAQKSIKDLSSSDQKSIADAVATSEKDMDVISKSSLPYLKAIQIHMSDADNGNQKARYAVFDALTKLDTGGALRKFNSTAGNWGSALIERLTGLSLIPDTDWPSIKETAIATYNAMIPTLTDIKTNMYGSVDALVSPNLSDRAHTVVNGLFPTLTPISSTPTVAPNNVWSAPPVRRKATLSDF